MGKKNKFIDLHGKKLGNWTVLELDKTTKYRGQKWICQCDCGKIYKVDGQHLRRGESSKCIYCKYRGPKKKIPAKLWSTIKENAANRGYKLHITKEFIFNLLVKQNFKCALTGVELKLSNTIERHQYGLTTASLDRINNDGDYTEDNVQWVHKDINRMKWKFSQDDFLKICKLIYNHNKDKMDSINIESFILDSNNHKKDRDNILTERKIDIAKEIT